MNRTARPQKVTPPYLPLTDFDDDAEYYITQALRSANDQAWTGLLSPEYALQTHRVLASMIDVLNSTYTYRNAELSKSRRRNAAGETTSEQHRQVLTEHEDWARRASHFRTLVDRRYRQAADAANARRGFTLATDILEVLLVLGDAVMQHREQVSSEREPTQADQLLWLRLSTLQVPAVARPLTLEENVLKRRERTADGPS
jgi:hypothetical protein